MLDKGYKGAVFSKIAQKEHLFGGLTIGSSQTTYIRSKINLQSAVVGARELILHFGN